MIENDDHDLDVVVSGGGPVGLVCAIGFAELGAKVTVIDPIVSAATLTGPISPRVYAIVPSVKKFLDDVGVWKHLASNRVGFFERIAIKDEYSGGELDFEVPRSHRGHMAWIVEHDNLLFASMLRLAELKVGQLKGKVVDVMSTERMGAIFLTEESQKIGARLGVIADGAKSVLRHKMGISIKRHCYEAKACVATVESELKHNNTARQYFLPSGPLAFLPLPEPNQWSIVWSCDDKKAKELEVLPRSEISNKLSCASNQELGKISVKTEQFWFPLQLLFTESWVKEKCVLVGDSAHVVHPLAGQGLNAGLLDVAALLKSLDFAGLDKNWPRRKDLFAYGRCRKYETRKVGIATHFIHTLFRLDDNPIHKMRRLGLSVLDRAPVLKDWLVAEAMGGIS